MLWIKDSVQKIAHVMMKVLIWMNDGLQLEKNIYNPMLKKNMKGGLENIFHCMEDQDMMKIVILT